MKTRNELEWTSPRGEIRSIFLKAIELWGEQFQLNMVAEECCELAKAVLKLSRKTNGTTIECVLDEMADVYLMLGQLEVMLDKRSIEGSVNERLNDAFIRKMERLEEIIEKEAGKG